MLTFLNSKARVCLLALSLFIFTGCEKLVDQLPNGSGGGNSSNKSWTVSTIAGSGKAGYLDGAALNADFNFPSFLALNSSGQLFVSDLQNFAIRKIVDGQVTTYAGRPINDGGDLLWGHIYGLAIDKKNNIFDIEYSLIRKITSSTSSSVFAGSLAINYKDGKGPDAAFNIIQQITMDKDGNMYVPAFDMDAKFLIRKVTPEGIVSTLTLKDETGYSSGSTTTHYYTSPIAVDKTGNIYFTANANSLIKKRDANGNVTVFAGSNRLGFGDGKGQDAIFYQIGSLATDSNGNLIVADGGNNAIRKITPDGTVSTIAGGAGSGFKDGVGITALFNIPRGLAIDKKDIIYVADAGNHRIRKIEYK